MFERVENFSESDIQLPKEVLDEMSDQDFHTDEQTVEDIHEPVLNDGEVEIGEVIKEDPKEFDDDGFNKDGFNEAGFDKSGFNDKGFNKDGNDKDGTAEFNEDGFNTQGFDKDGLNKTGFNEKGFDKDGKNKDGKTEKDFVEGYNTEGFDPLGYDKDGKDKDGNTAPKEETGENQQPESNLEDGLNFQDIVDGKKDVSITDKDGNEISLKNVLTDWSNNENWKKSNTENAQANAKEKDENAQAVKEFDEKNVALDKVIEILSKDKEFMEQADVFFEGKDKNPIRKIFETVTQSKESVANRIKAEETEQVETAEKVQKTFDDEVALIIADDEKFNDNREMQKIYKIAKENNCSITTAYKLSKIPLSEKQLEEKETTHKTELEEVNKKLTDSQEELKKRNEELNDLKANPKLIEPDDDSENAIGAGNEVDDSIAKGWGEATKKIKKQWKI